MSTILHQPSITMTIERCFDCGTFWAIEQGHRGRCPKCSEERINRVLGEQNKLERRLNAQKAATARVRGRKR